MLRRTNDDINCLLPSRYECAVFCRPSELQCELYNKLTVDYNKSESLPLLTRLRKLCSHPDLLDESSQNIVGAPAPPPKFIAASSVVPSASVSSELQKRGTLQARSPTQEKIASATTSDTKSGKMELLEELLRSIRASTDEKVVVISNFTNALDVIEKIVTKRNWGFSRLDGTTSASDRQGIVDTFNRSSAANKFVFLLSSKAGGVGLNLVGANRLVMFDADWNPATDAQAMGRIYRTGQKLPCFIYRLFLAGTVEEVILQRQLQKGNLALDGAKKGKKRGTASEFSKEELKDCFTLKENAVCETNDKFGGNWASGEMPDDMIDKDCSFAQIANQRNDLITFVRYGSDRDARCSSIGSIEDKKSAIEDMGDEEGEDKHNYGIMADEDCIDEDEDIYFDEEEYLNDLSSEEEFDE